MRFAEEDEKDGHHEGAGKDDADCDEHAELQFAAPGNLDRILLGALLHSDRDIALGFATQPLGASTRCTVARSKHNSAEIPELEKQTNVCAAPAARRVNGCAVA
jgi:hypothetical protein